MGNIPLAVIAGPTASGKTALAVAVAQCLSGEVISADSMQIYEDLTVGTARPTAEEMRGVVHHLMGFVPLTASYSVAQYASDAHRTIAAVTASGRLPVLCGGTGLYLRAVTENLSFSDQPEDRSVRERLKEEATRVGGEALLARLSTIDPETAARLHAQDIGRIVRALEVFETTGKTMTEQNRLSRAVPSPYRCAMLLLTFRDRQKLYDRIDARVDAMMAGGLCDEAVRLLATPGTDTVRQAIGYKELAPYLAGEMSREEAVENIKKGTRHYAKRQLSWFRGMTDADPLYVDDYATPAALADEACRRIRERLYG